MRIIKFRAWDELHKIMLSRHDGYSYDVDILEEAPRYMQENGFVLMQFIGLHDKNGKEIYEGDLLNYTGMNGRTFLGVVEFFNGAFVLSHEIGYSPFLQSAGKNDEVIGNIYTTPELWNKHRSNNARKP